MKEAAELFELAPEEIAIGLTFREGGGKLRIEHLLKPPTLADWLAYDQAYQLAHETDERGWEVWANRSAEAAEILWDRLALTVQGYWADGLPDDWKEKIPVDHKIPAVNAFLEVIGGAGTDGAAEWREGERAVYLSAKRGKTLCEPLIHRFRRPSASDKIRWERIHSGAFLVEHGSFRRSTLPARLADQVRIYDELILGAEGYAARGEPLTGPEACRRLMDAWHKRVATLQLFNPQEPHDSDDESAAPEAA